MPSISRPAAGRASNTPYDKSRPASWIGWAGSVGDGTACRRSSYCNPATRVHACHAARHGACLRPSCNLPSLFRCSAKTRATPLRSATVHRRRPPPCRPRHVTSRHKSRAADQFFLPHVYCTLCAALCRQTCKLQTESDVPNRTRDPGEPRSPGAQQPSQQNRTGRVRTGQIRSGTCGCGVASCSECDFAPPLTT